MTIGWQLLAQSEKTTGIQVWVAQQHGLQVKIEPVTVWYDHSSRRVLALKDLFAPAGWAAAHDSILDALSPRPYRRSVVQKALASAGPGGKGLTFGFASDESMVVSFAAHALSSTSAPVSVRLSSGPLTSRLSPAGRAAGASVRNPRHGASPPAQVDCTKRKCAALTFDDGPGPYTAELVATLQQRKVPATFFLVGDRVRQSPELVATLDQAGLAIGNHTSYHHELTFLSARSMTTDLEATSRAIAAVTGHRPTLLRPPYGSRNSTVDAVSKKLKMAEILWDVDTLDWLHADPAWVRNAAVKPAKRGSIILMHDINRTTRPPCRRS